MKKWLAVGLGIGVVAGGIFFAARTWQWLAAKIRRPWDEDYVSEETLFRLRLLDDDKRRDI